MSGNIGIGTMVKEHRDDRHVIEYNCNEERCPLFLINSNLHNASRKSSHSMKLQEMHMLAVLPCPHHPRMHFLSEGT